ncbi:hypothetical protein BpHYR1_007302 [Brachionus plicatilis]|uniref:Uncharacterized protein n=1 Tax=Brachionus plicatilis TaxID=10195 RepID=A0A3M7R4M9_BRAPC|nr:hypothetical protein BpHYR1_007302 [Brachionus plicatilis]
MSWAFRIQNVPLKLLNRKKNLPNVEKDIRNWFLFMFTLILNSVSIIEVENYLINIHNVFNNPKFDVTVIYSLNLLQNKIKERNLSNSDISCERTTKENERDNEFQILLEESEALASEVSEKYS